MTLSVARRGSTSTLFLLMFASVLSAQVTHRQTLPPNLEHVITGQTSTVPFAVDPVPPSTGARTRVQYIYDSSFFCIQAPITITQLSFRMRSCSTTNPAGGDWSDLTIDMGTTANLTSSVTGTFNTNYLTGPVTVRTGPFNTGPILGCADIRPWISLGLTTPFVYDPSLGQDLIIELRRCEGTSSAPGPLLQLLPGTGNDVVNSTLARRVVLNGTVLAVPNVCSTTSAVGAVSAAGSPFALVLQVQYIVNPAPPIAWETNSPEASLRIDGKEASICGPLDIRKCVNSYSRIQFASTLPGGWEIGLNSSLGLAGNGGGGINTLNGQVINLDLVGGTPLFVFDQTFPPFPGNFHIPFISSTPIPNISAQIAVLDPAHPDGAQLSQLAQLHYDAPTPLLAPAAGPTTDDGFTTVNVGCIPFFGMAFSQIAVCTNGRIIFGPAFNTGDFTPTVEECRQQQPMVGVFTDLHVVPTPAGPPNGTISTSSPTADTFRVAWNGVYYRGTMTALTFAIEFNTSNGEIRIDTGAGIPINPEPGIPAAADAMFVGLSRGLFGATNPGPTAFNVSAGNFPASNTDMIYNFATLGGPALFGGATQLIFTPINGGSTDGNYFWTGM